MLLYCWMTIQYHNRIERKIREKRRALADDGLIEIDGGKEWKCEFVQRTDLGPWVGSRVFGSVQSFVYVSRPVTASAYFSQLFLQQKQVTII